MRKGQGQVYRRTSFFYIIIQLFVNEFCHIRIFVTSIVDGSWPVSESGESTFQLSSPLLVFRNDWKLCYGRSV